MGVRSSAGLAALLVIAAAVAAATAADLAAPSPGASCASVVTPLQPCLDFLRGKDKAPSKACCEGAKKLNDSVKTKDDKQKACECIKSALKSMDSIDASKIPEIPKQCNIDTSLPPIDANFDCSTIKSAYEGR